MTGVTTGQRKNIPPFLTSQECPPLPFSTFVLPWQKKRRIANTFLLRDACKSESHQSCVFGCMNELKLQATLGWQVIPQWSVNRQRSYLPNRGVDRRVERPTEKKSDGLKIAARGY